MHPQLLVRPVISRLPTKEINVFHVFESFFDVGQVAIGLDDLMRQPVKIVRHQDGFSKTLVAQID